MARRLDPKNAPAVDVATLKNIVIFCHQNGVEVPADIQDIYLVKVLKLAIERNQLQVDPMSEEAIEKEIMEKGKNAPKLTPEYVDSVIHGEQYHVFSGSQMTVCCLTLKNGFSVIGQSGCASPENFDAEIGRKVAREKARSRIWELEGYLLKQGLSDQAHG